MGVTGYVTGPTAGRVIGAWPASHRKSSGRADAAVVGLVAAVLVGAGAGIAGFGGVVFAVLGLSATVAAGLLLIASSPVATPGEVITSQRMREPHPVTAPRAPNAPRAVNAPRAARIDAGRRQEASGRRCPMVRARRRKAMRSSSFSPPQNPSSPLRRA